MTKNEFIFKLTAELKNNQIQDIEEIISEYEQHFDFKLADGYTEEEISAKLGLPENIAAQYERENTEVSHRKNYVITKIGFCFADFFVGIVFLILAVWGAVMAAFSLACAGVAVCLICGLNVASLIPAMPYWCGVVIGISLAALSVLAAAGCVYYAAFLRQLTRKFGRFQYNILAPVCGKPVLPAVPASGQFSPKIKRRLRHIISVSLVIFAVCFILGFIASVLSAGAIEFWHSWGWFGYNG